MILRKNKKEKFSQLSTENLQAIKNLGDLAIGQITSPSDPGKLKLNELIIKDGSTDINVLQTIKDIKATNESQGTAISAAQAKADAALPKSGGTINGNLVVNGAIDTTKLMAIETIKEMVFY